MQHILYFSQARSGLDSGEVFRIIETSARNNPAREVTGFLAFAHGLFLQLVEGPAQALDELLEVLKGDPRHHGLEIMERGPVAARSFPGWRMERLAIRGDDRSALVAHLAKAGISRAAIARVEDLFVADRIRG